MSAARLLNYYLCGGASINAALWVVLALRIFENYPSNHTGFQPYWLWAVVIGTSGAIAAPHYVRRNIGWVILGIWGALFLSLIVMDRFNILVQYDVWGSRGMPAWGEFH